MGTPPYELRNNAVVSDLPVLRSMEIQQPFIDKYPGAPKTLL